MAPAISATRTALVNVITTRLQAQGILIDSSQIGALISDIEFQINANAGTVLADVVADLGLLPDPPVGGQ
jgi:hypothetical protein